MCPLRLRNNENSAGTFAFASIRLASRIDHLYLAPMEPGLPRPAQRAEGRPTHHALSVTELILVVKHDENQVTPFGVDDFREVEADLLPGDVLPVRQVVKYHHFLAGRRDLSSCGGHTGSIVSVFDKVRTFELCTAGIGSIR